MSVVSQQGYRHSPYAKHRPRAENTITPAASPGRSPRSPSVDDHRHPLGHHVNGHTNGHINGDGVDKYMLETDPSSVFRLLADNTAFDDEHAANAAPATIQLTGQDLTISQLRAVMRHGARVDINSSPAAKRAVQASVDALQAHLKAGHCIYGVNTGFGASADSRTNQPDVLQAALLQMQHIGVIPSLAAGSKHTMPEPWVRGAMAIRINSLLRGHSAVRWEVLERLAGLLNHDAVPVVPLRGSISASGDLSPLSYIAGAVSGQVGIYCFVGPAGERVAVPASEALAGCGIPPVEFRAKEVLGLINGTSVSCAVAATVVSEAAMLTQLAQALTAMAVEVSLGSAEPFDPWVAGAARPHPGQAAVAANIWHLLGDSQLVRDRHGDLSTDAPNGLAEGGAAGADAHVGLRQDRYPLRTAPQWIGPQLEDLDLAIAQLGVECNSTTDNPLIDTTTAGGGAFARIMHAGNFQAMHVTAAMEKTRSALQNVGKLVFQQLTEVVNYCTAPLPPNLASDVNPSLSYTMKAVDIAAAAYCSELGVLAAGNVGSHVQCAEDRNQAVNSLALVSARQADEMTDVLSMLMASNIYVLCQATDLRVMLRAFAEQLEALVRAETYSYFKGMVAKKELRRLGGRVYAHVQARFDATMRDDARPRFADIFATATSVVLDALAEHNPRPGADPTSVLAAIALWRQNLTHKALTMYTAHRDEYVAGGDGQQQQQVLSQLGRTGQLYRFVRSDLHVPMHRGQDDLPVRDGKPVQREAQTLTTGAMISRIYDAIRDGRMAHVLVGMFDSA